MRTLRLGLVLASVTVLVLLAQPSTAAGEIVATSLAPVTLPSTQLGTIENTDEDAYDEAYLAQSVGGPCGCYCPVVGAGFDLAAAGQRVTFGTATAMLFCGTSFGLAANPGDANPGYRPYFEPTLTLDWAGLDTGLGATR